MLARMNKRQAYTLAEAALRLGRRPATLRQQIRNGKLIAYKFGRDWIVDDHEVERYALEHRRADRDTAHPSEQRTGVTIP